MGTRRAALVKHGKEGLAHRPEKWLAVFGKADAKTRRWIIGPDAISGPMIQRR